ncbi:MAG: hypothetical protein ACM3SY_06500 [Candidatus Omnitrophota bacterium]
MRKFSLILFVFILVGMSGTVLHAGSFNIKAGFFYPRLNSDLWAQNLRDLVFTKSDMDSGYFGLEYDFFLARNFAVSIEGGHYKKERLSRYKDVTYPDSAIIPLNQSLEILNLEADVKIFPLGYRLRVYPYVGGGVGLYFWKYMMWGDYVNNDGSISQNIEAKTSTATPGFNAKGGVAFRFAKYLGAAIEGRYQVVKGKLSSDFEGFEKLDLNGFSVTLGLNIFL